MNRTVASSSSSSSSSKDVKAASSKALVHDPSSSLPASPTSVAYLKVLKNYTLLMEYKRLQQQAPTGIYVLPAADSLRRWYGVLFLRKGHYRGGIFKFVILIPNSYPDTAPTVHFLSEVFHPLIHPDTGLLDITRQFPQWIASKHFIVILLSYIKRIFYKTEYWDAKQGVEPMNRTAQKLWTTDPTEYLRLCTENCSKSQHADKIYSVADDSKMSIVFARPQQSHEEAHRRIVGQQKEKGTAGSSYLEWFEDGVFKLENAGAAGTASSASSSSSSSSSLSTSHAFSPPLPITAQPRSSPKSSAQPHRLSTPTRRVDEATDEQEEAEA